MKNKSLRTRPLLSTVESDNLSPKLSSKLHLLGSVGQLSVLSESLFAPDYSQPYVLGTTEVKRLGEGAHAEILYKTLL